MPKVKAIKAEYGASVEIKGVWHKFNFGIELELSENDDSDIVKEKAWNTCEVEIEKQIQQIISSK